MNHLLWVGIHDRAHPSHVNITLLKQHGVEACQTSFDLDRVKGTKAAPSDRGDQAGMTRCSCGLAGAGQPASVHTRTIASLVSKYTCQ